MHKYNDKELAGMPVADKSALSAYLIGHRGVPKALADEERGVVMSAGGIGDGRLAVLAFLSGAYESVIQGAAGAGFTEDDIKTELARVKAIGQTIGFDTTNELAEVKVKMAKRAAARGEAGHA